MLGKITEAFVRYVSNRERLEGLLSQKICVLRLSLPFICLLSIGSALAQDRATTRVDRQAQIVPSALPFKPGARLRVKILFTANQSFPDFNGIGTFDPTSGQGTYLSYGQWLELRIYVLDSSAGEPTEKTPYRQRRSVDYRTVPAKGSRVEREFEAFRVPRVESGKFLFMKLWLVAEVPPSHFGDQTKGIAYAPLGNAKFVLNRSGYDVP